MSEKTPGGTGGLTHQIHCGDYRTVLADLRADLIVTSPPYNIGSKHPRHDGFRRLGRYDPKSYGAIRDYPDALPEQEYQTQQGAFFLWCADHLTRDGILVYNHKPRRKEACLRHPAEWFLAPAVRDRLQLMEEIIWDRGSTHNHCNRLLWPQTERLYVFRRQEGVYRFLNHGHLQYRTDVWRIPRSPANGHNAPFPLALACAVIEAWSAPGMLVCDPHAGSGTTGIAARQLGRAFVGTEILKKYYELARTRLVPLGEDAP
jgi:site-specific DNA-methyltransferase (adenine-specific)